jgi:O-antigen/teichoic acid export membrane protein
LTITELFLFLCLFLFIFIRYIPFRITPAIGTYIPKHLSFGSKGIFGGILVELNTRVDILFLGYFYTYAKVGIYSFAAMLAEGFGQIPYALRWSVDPIIGKLFSQNRVTDISKLSKRTRQEYFPVIVFLGILAIIVYPLFFKYFSKTSITESWIVFVIIMIGVILNARYRPFAGIFLQGGKPAMHTLLILVLVIGDALLNLIFIPWLGINGAAIVTAWTYIFAGILLVYFTKRLFDIQL